MFGDGERPYATIAAILAPAILVLVHRADIITLIDLGVIVGDVGDSGGATSPPPWSIPTSATSSSARSASRSSAARSSGGSGPIATLVLMIAAGALGMLAADGIEGAHRRARASCCSPRAATASRSACSAAGPCCRRAELRADPDQEVDAIGAAVCAAVLILLPLVEDFANVFAGLGGALVGAACGFVASYARRERRAE